MYEVPDFIGRGESLQIVKIFFASMEAEAVVGCGPMSFNVTIKDDSKGDSKAFYATTTLSDTSVCNYNYTAVVTGCGDTDKRAKEWLKAALENLIHAARWRIDEIEKDLN